jgi:hypothetical protein
LTQVQTTDAYHNINQLIDAYTIGWGKVR